MKRRNGERRRGKEARPFDEILEIHSASLALTCRSMISERDVSASTATPRPRVATLPGRRARNVSLVTPCRYVTNGALRVSGGEFLPGD